MNTHVEQDWPPQDQVKDVEENEEEPDEEDPIVCFYPNIAEITRRQGTLSFPHIPFLS